MSDKDHKKDRDRDRTGDEKPRAQQAPRTGNVAPPDPELVKWMEKLWTRGNAPDRLEVWWVIGTRRNIRQGLVFFENFKQDKPLNLEECTSLCGEIHKAVQDWTDGKRVLCDFEIAIIDFHQAAAPLRRPLGPLVPAQGYNGVHPDGEPMGEGDEEETGLIGLKPLSHRYLAKTQRLVLRTMEEVHAVLGDTVRLQQAIIISQQSHNERLQNANMALYDQNQVAMDRATERTIWVKREETKIKAIGSGLKLGQNLLYGWFGMSPEAGSGDGDGAGQGNGSGASPGRRYPASAEQRLVESFLEEAAEEKLSVQFFGDWQDTDRLTIPDVFAGLGLKSPGIFSPPQFGILLAVREGLSPPDALDALLPGGAQAITQEQFTQAMPLLSQSMVVALQQIQSLREQKKKALAEQPAAPAHNGEEAR